MKVVLVALVTLVAVACNSGGAPAASTGSSARGRFAGVALAISRGDVPKTTSVLVMRRGAIEHEAYFGDAAADTLHDSRSVGKSITALAIGVAIDRGLLRLDEPVFPHLADLRPFAHDGPAKQAITVADFLTMSSALACDDDDPASPGNEANMYPRRTWARWAVDLPTHDGYERDASGRGPFRYCTAGTFLLGQLLQRVAAQPVDAFIATHLFAPLGITRWEVTRSPTGEVMTGGMLRLRTRDLAALGELVRARGAKGDRQLVSRAFVDAALTVQRRTRPSLKADYGYLFWRRVYPTPCGALEGWYMSGNGGNAVVIVDAVDAVIVVTRQHYDQGGKMHDQTAALIADHILPELACGQSPAR